MTVYKCICGAKYSAPPGSEGRRARCSHCQAEFIIPGVEPVGVGPPSAPPAPPVAGLDSTVPVDGGGSWRAAEPGALGGARGFWRDIAWSLLFFIEPSNLATFVVVWLVMAIQNAGLPGVGPGIAVLAGPFAFAIGMVLGVIFAGWLMSFFMNVIREAAAGELDLPRFAMLDDFVEDILAPLLCFGGTWFFLLLPAGVLATVEAVWGLGIPNWSITLAVRVGIFFWPMSVLCVSLGGLAVFVQVNLMIDSVIKTFWIYIAVCCLFGVCIWAVLVAAGMTAMPGGLTVPATPSAAVAAAWVETYALIVAMRAIGLYYHHYKQRFAWSWG